MLEQFSREWLQLYPQARVLAASSDDLAGERRRTFVARTAANDWDAVILTRSAFARLPVSPETKIAYTRRELAQLRAMLEHSKGAGGADREAAGEADPARGGTPPGAARLAAGSRG